MLIASFYDGVEIHRGNKFIAVKFVVPHRVISTCRVNGGITDSLEMVFNHQVCEPSDHFPPVQKLAIDEPSAYMEKICSIYKLSHNSASLSTAANMNCASIQRMEFRKLEVVAICTAGVEGNAGCAGDPANIYEENGQFRPVEETETKSCGTINVIACINKPLIPGAMVRSVITATEAKAAALRELNVNSRYSSNLATGTGTDQLAIASMLTGEKPLTGAGKHTKLGELIGKTVKKAVKEALSYQCKLTPENQRSLIIHLERFGTDRETAKKEIVKCLPEEKAKLFEDNFAAIDRDPLSVAGVAALVHLFDKLHWGILPETCTKDVFVTHGAHLAAAVSGKYECVPLYRDKLSELHLTCDNDSFLRVVYKSLAIGFEEKWD